MSRASPTTPDPWAAVTISPTWLGCSDTNPQAHTHTRIRSIYLHPSAGVLATIIGRQSAPHTPCPVPTVFEASLLLLLPTGYPSLLPSPVATPHHETHSRQRISSPAQTPQRSAEHTQTPAPSPIPPVQRGDYSLSLSRAHQGLVPLGGCSAFLGESGCAESGDLGARLSAGSSGFPSVPVVWVMG